MSALAVATGSEDRELEDLELVAAARAGDDRAFEALFLRYQPRIAAYVAGMVRDHGRAEDITQEVFMSALRRLRDGDDEREIVFRPWIYEIAKNKCIDSYRRGRDTTELSFDAHDQIGAAEHGRLAEPGATPDAAVEGKLDLDNLRGAFGGLSPVHHEILVMREFEGLSYREIGDRLGMSRAAVESTLFRARKRLGEEYEELVSGKRCLRVRGIVDDSGARGAGLRDQRRVARHLAHCQSCRRHAFLAGADLDALARPASVAARVAAFLPLPAFLRRRWGGEEVTQFLGQQSAWPVAQWSAQVAGALDPGAVSGWAKVAATAATVALAGVGGAAIEHRVAPAPGPVTAAAADAAKAHQAGARTPRRMAGGLPMPPGADPADAPGGLQTPADAAGQSPAAAGAGDAGLARLARERRGRTAGRGRHGARPRHQADGQHAPLDPLDPLAPLGGVPGNAAAPVLDPATGAAGGRDRPGGGEADTAPAAGLSDPGRLLLPLLPPPASGAEEASGAETTDPRRTVGKPPGIADTTQSKEKVPASAPAPTSAPAAMSVPASAEDTSAAPARSGEPHGQRAQLVKAAPSRSQRPASWAVPRRRGTDRRRTPTARARAPSHTRR